MDREQYEKIFKSITAIRTDLQELGNEVTSISTWIKGDPNYKSSKGTDERITDLEDKVNRNERELENIKRLDAVEVKVEDHEYKLNKIFTAIMVIGVIGGIIGFLMGIFIPPYLP